MPKATPAAAVVSSKKAPRPSTARNFPCDVCGSEVAIEVPHSRLYTNNEPVHICMACGLVHVKRRRSFEEIADSWSNEIYGEGYTAIRPAIKARQTYVAEFIRSTVGTEGKKLADIGAGEGQFLEIARASPGNAKVFGIEPSGPNCKRLDHLKIDNFEGTIEAFAASKSPLLGKFDIVTIMWTLEACQQPRAMLEAAWALLRPGGHVFVATGSRLLVPFKKPLDLYLSKNAADTHALRFSPRTLKGLLAVSGFRPSHENRWLDSDVLIVGAQKVPKGTSVPREGDNPVAVANFFERWHVETQMYHARPETPRP